MSTVATLPEKITIPVEEFRAMRAAVTALVGIAGYLAEPVQDEEDARDLLDRVREFAEKGLEP